MPARANSAAKAVTGAALTAVRGARRLVGLAEEAAQDRASASRREAPGRSAKKAVKRTGRPQERRPAKKTVRRKKRK